MSPRSSLTGSAPLPGAAGRRMVACGKFLFADGGKFFVRGVTYGPFRPGPDGGECHHPAVVERDFCRMREHGFNAVRLYTPPPRWLLDLAEQQQLRVLVGLPWEQHVTFLSHRRQARDIERRLRAAVRPSAGHPAVLGYTVGNEIPSAMVRWYGHRRIADFLERLYWAAKEEDPEGLVTYVNYPSTEYLELPFLDFACFNVYLEKQDRFEAYLARLQNICGERPLVMGELGLDSLRNGEDRQARTLAWQTRTAFRSGCAGLFLFAWTDEWHRGGHDILDWRFGLTTAARAPKPALPAVRQALHDLPFALGPAPPLVSVVVCTHNGSRTLGACLAGVQRLGYPNFETIVVNDGSTDDTAALASEFEVRLISIPKGGLSNARNAGWQAAKGELVAYLDDDASPDPDWLSYLAAALHNGEFAGAGGPNVAWPDDGLIANCVDHAPGNPTHVLLTDSEAEHLPGCNMAFRRACLAAVGGFDPQFRIAGDDVDLCWRLQQRGWKLGFHPGALVWHHRRGTIRTYWRQQLNYGKAEAMLERKWPEKYNVVGHTTWNGRLYSKGLFAFPNLSSRRIYHGTWGSALFQSVYRVAPGTLASVLMMPEWYLVIGLLAVVLMFGLLYAPLRFAVIPLALAFVPPLSYAALNGARAFFRVAPRSPFLRLKLGTVTAWLHFLQPAARLWGRLAYGLTPWRRRGTGGITWPTPRAVALWHEQDWQSAEKRLEQFERSLRLVGAPVARGGEFDRWDLEVRGGLLGSARLLMVIEEHGAGRQYVRLRLWPMAQPLVLVAALLFAVLAMIAATDLEWTAWALLNLPAILLVGRTLYEAANAMGALQRVVARAAAPPFANRDPDPLSPPAPTQPPVPGREERESSRV